MEKDFSRGESYTPPLFREYPRLGETVPHESLGRLPTSLERAEEAARILGLGALLLKRDDLSGVPYGGNKVRKLEFVLAHALRKGARTVMTFGGAGSNHALATALYARRLGLKTIAFLRDQVNAGYVRRNLLMNLRAGTELHFFKSRRALKYGSLLNRARSALLSGRRPYVIPSGGSSPLGTVGFVNAAFELRDQLKAGNLPEPDILFVALGTGGTAAGLMLGLKAAGLKTRVAAVRVVSPVVDFTKRCLELVKKTNELLRSYDPSFPGIPFSAEDFTVRDDFCGPGYAVFTEEGREAIEFAARHTGLKLEGTYTGKTFAALSADARRGVLTDRTVLFWNTYNSYDFSEEIEALDYKALPKPFHRYFENPLQDLDEER